MNYVRPIPFGGKIDHRLTEVEWSLLPMGQSQGLLAFSLPSAIFRPRSSLFFFSATSNATKQDRKSSLSILFNWVWSFEWERSKLSPTTHLNPAVACIAQFRKVSDFSWPGCDFSWQGSDSLTTVKTMQWQVSDLSLRGFRLFMNGCNCAILYR